MLKKGILIIGMLSLVACKAPEAPKKNNKRSCHVEQTQAVNPNQAKEQVSQES